ncbi:uncharacterized protein LOC130447991 isoform X3 [Diorhabda sublineata]|uniref:uncharacterized protein LOC130447991 isoform X3 n=1 Tax=Diorhabda sublineata TaxID=1163346 RepID=UPI0024E0ECB2|nr:uncharacterized protein LOC130447991 isoform X3 [Diorhabda sublineata]
MRSLLNIFIFTFTGFVLTYGKMIPEYLPRCNRYDKNLNDCLLTATETMKPYLRKGIPELKIPPFEPFIIPEINLEQGTSALNFKATLINTEIYGLTDYTFTRFDFDVPNLQFFCDCNINCLTLKGNYTVSGKIFVAPILGSGTFTASVENCNASVYQKVKIEKLRNDQDFIVPTLTNSSINVSGPKANLQGLFNGNKQLSEITNKIINDNINELFQDLKPVLEKIMTEILEDMLLKAIEGQVPFDELYPPLP